jgi:voltage-gated sodium channel
MARGPLILMLDRICLAIFVVELGPSFMPLGRASSGRAGTSSTFRDRRGRADAGRGGFSVLRALRILRVLRLVSVVPACAGWSRGS